MEYDDFELLTVSIDEGVALVTIDGPEEGNAHSITGHAELGSVWPRLEDDQRVDAVVLTGAGETFCVGPTAEMIERMSADDPHLVRQVMEEVRRLVIRSIEFEKPLVTAVNGTVKGGPLITALLSDIVIAERQVVFSDPHVTVAVAAGDGGVLAWPMAMGLLRAKRYLMTGDAITAEQACQLGLVTEVVEQGASLERAMVFARRFAAGPRHALRYTKRALNEWYRIGMPAFDVSFQGELMTATVPDAKEGWGEAIRGGSAVMPPDPDQAVVPDKFGQQIE
jgi:enoyl-CoA hydratase